MKIYSYYDKADGDFVVILGFFDCIHIGHVALIEKGINIAENLGITPAVFTYSNNPAEVLGKSFGQVLTYKERLVKLEKHLINAVISCDFDMFYATRSGEEFLDELFENFSVKAVVCGYDYTYGKNASCNAEDLKRYCERKKIPCYVNEEVKFDGRRVSTTLIKEYLSVGNIKAANALLGEPYFVVGTVVRGRQDGRKIGFPTANVLFPKDKFQIKKGVYKTRVRVQGKEYKAITNYGSQPTFNEDSIVLESHIKGFDRDIYGEEITVIFDDYIRDIVRFYDTDNLVKQLKKDMECLDD